MKFLITFLILILIPSLSYSQEPIQFPRLASTPNDAHILALRDLKNLSPQDRPFMKYLWVPEFQLTRFKAISYILNTISRNGVNIPPPILGNDFVAYPNKVLRMPPLKGVNAFLVRVDLRNYYPKEKDLQEALTLWESFTFDPSFSLFLTQDVIQNLIDEGQGDNLVLVVKKVREEVEVPPYLWTDGKVYHHRWQDRWVKENIRIKDVKDISLIRLPATHLDLATYEELQRLTGSQAPVAHYGYWACRVLSTIKEDGIFKEIYGGLYYDFAGIKRSIKKGQSDEDLFYTRLGLIVDKGGIEAFFDELGSDQRSAMFRSNVTKKPRRLDWFITPAARATESVGVAFVTHDLKAKNIDISQHPMYNLVKFKDAAREVIATKANGLHLFALFNEKGELQDEVPFDVAKDYTLPKPDTGRLEAAISCIRCHGTEAQGWQPFKNEVQLLYKSYRDGFDIYGDTTNAEKSIPEVLARLAGQYTGESEDILRLARDHYAKAILRSTGPWPQGGDQTGIATLVSQEVADIWTENRLQQIDAVFVMQDIGFIVVKEQSLPWLRILLPPEKRARRGDLIPEDISIQALKSGLAINREDYDRVRNFLQERTHRNYKLLRSNK